MPIRGAKDDKRQTSNVKRQTSNVIKYVILNIKEQLWFIVHIVLNDCQNQQQFVPIVNEP
jgi:hypothetical protein